MLAKSGSSEKQGQISQEERVRVSLIVLGGLAYCSMLWCGAVYFHLSRKHHPAAVVPAGFFVLLVFAITALRYPFWMALVGQLACALGAVALGWLLVTPADQRPGLLMT